MLALPRRFGLQVRPLEQPPETQNWTAATSQQGKMPPLANITEETPRRSPRTVRHPHSAASCARAPP
jgi:hypothetical protein